MIGYCFPVEVEMDMGVIGSAKPGCRVLCLCKLLAIFDEGGMDELFLFLFVFGLFLAKKLSERKVMRESLNFSCDF